MSNPGPGRRVMGVGVSVTVRGLGVRTEGTGLSTSVPFLLSRPLGLALAWVCPALQAEEG